MSTTSKIANGVVKNIGMGYQNGNSRIDDAEEKNGITNGSNVSNGSNGSVDWEVIDGTR